MIKNLLNLFSSKKEVKELKYSDVMIVKLHYGWVVINCEDPGNNYEIISNIYKTKQEAYDSQSKEIREMILKQGNL